MKLLRRNIWYGLMLCGWLVCITMLQAQDSIPRNWSVSGYLTNMQSVMFNNWQENWVTDNLFHNRLNLNWHTSDKRWNVELDLRNRLLYGESVKLIPNYKAMVGADDNWLKLSGTIASGKSYLLHSAIDRAYLDYNAGKTQVRLGRQRINWGQCMAWNPNDLFNAYSFFDFDYVEKPGSDAVRLQYYPSGTSTVELAAKANAEKKMTAAALYRANRWGYDIQLLGGVFNEQDWVLGAGWTGSLGGASFSGECSYFHPRQHFADTTGLFVASVGALYVFRNSLSLQGEVLYNPLKGNKPASFNSFYLSQLSPKQLSVSEWNVLIQGSYPVTPLFNASFAAMWFPGLNGYFVGPTLSYSIAENFELSLITQSFVGKLSGGQQEHVHLGFVRVKWNW
ncbi:hypothetical protein [Parabacteroides sp. FAFU027]|uniref:hypothetical protein n=1 Tax=Parabacteroides sp. FAFU027 TaxID=2922715 RepID=UPI001FAE9026|nr:hypothetical protein [Parabacteroides sp. FAFU027]